MFGFQRLDAYQAAIAFLGVSARLLEGIPRGYGDLADQLRRAALSVPLNIAEGSGRINRDAGQFYVIARGSALECAALLDAMEVLTLADDLALREPRGLLERVVSMLTGLVRLRTDTSNRAATTTTTTSTSTSRNRPRPLR
jgi:four helix bundle protein